MTKPQKAGSTKEQGTLQIPAHIAIIMDGNGRWAASRGIPRIEGHRRGVESLKQAIQGCMELGVKYLTVYAFSTENWNRPKEEINLLMELLLMALDKEVTELQKNNIKLRFMGRINMLNEKLQKKIQAAEHLTSENSAFNLNVMLNYGGRAEIEDTIKTIVNNGIKSDKINENMISRYMYTSGIPDPDLLIRTAGEMRISNFMLWQIAYSELWVTKTLWPDFKKEDLFRAVEDYNGRNRKFGGL